MTVPTGRAVTGSVAGSAAAAADGAAGHCCGDSHRWDGDGAAPSCLPCRPQTGSGGSAGLQLACAAAAGGKEGLHCWTEDPPLLRARCAAAAEMEPCGEVGGYNVNDAAKTGKKCL